MEAPSLCTICGAPNARLCDLPLCCILCLAASFRKKDLNPLVIIDVLILIGAIIVHRLVAMNDLGKELDESDNKFWKIICQSNSLKRFLIGAE
jgi:hypothetical protein